MTEFLQSVLALIVTLSILVTFHEFGHYWVARLCGVRVLRFSVGFGKPLWSFYGKPPADMPPPADQTVGTRDNEPPQGTEFAIAAIPLGGYVKMLDEREGFVPDDQLHLAFNRKPVLQRIAIVVAGPLANFILAIAAYWVLFVAGVTGIVPLLGDVDEQSKAGRAGLQAGQEIVAIDGESVRTWSDVNMVLFQRIGDTGEITITASKSGNDGTANDYMISINNWLSDADEPRPTQDLGLSLKYPEIPAVVGSVLAGGAAEAAGLQQGDEILRVNGTQVRDWQHWVETIQQNPETSLALKVRRANGIFDLTIVPKAEERNGRTVGYIGAAREPVEFPEEMQRTVSYPLYSAWIPAVEKTWSVTAFTLNAIKKMIMGAISTKNLSGPITIAQVANATAQSGLESFIGFIALLSISLGVLNLLPIPVLDGGHLLYYLVELISGRPVPERVQVWGFQLGLFIIVSIMLLAFYNDLTRL